MEDKLLNALTVGGPAVVLAAVVLYWVFRHMIPSIMDEFRAMRETFTAEMGEGRKQAEADRVVFRDHLQRLTDKVLGDREK